MRRIETESARERRKKRNTMIMSLVMLVILVSGTAGFAFSFGGGGFGSGDSGGEDVVEVGEGEVGYDNTRGRYFLNYGGQNIFFFNSPADVLETDVDIFYSLGDYRGRELYINAERDIISNEIGSTLGLYASRVQRACYGECDEDLPEIDCTQNLIVVEESEFNTVRQEENCIFIDGKMKAVDAFLYKVFGVN